MLIQGGQAEARPAAMRRPMVRALLNTLLVTFGFAIALIVPARAWSFGRGWVMIGLFLIIHTVGTLRIIRVNPDLLRERARFGRQGGQPMSDKVLLYSFTVSYTAMLVISSADGARWHIWPAPPAVAACAGLALFAAGWVLVLR